MRFSSALRWTRVLLHFFCAWFTCVLLFRFYRPAAQRDYVQRWSGQFLRLLQVKLEHTGSLPGGACVLVANHLSWLDIFVILALQPAAFIAKSETRAWPMIGSLLAASGTIFIDRSRRKAVHETLQTMQQRLSHQQAVAFFPEGTTSDGRALLPFHSNLFAAVLNQKTPASTHPVVPLAIHYQRHGAPCFDPAYIDHDTLLTSMRRVIRAQPFTAALCITPALNPADYTSRQALASDAQTAIAAALGHDKEASFFRSRMPAE